MEKLQENSEKAQKEDRRKYNKGGSRPGAGRPLSLRGKLMRGLLPRKDAYLLEKIITKQFRHGQMRRVKVSRIDFACIRLFELAKNGNTAAESLNKKLTEMNKQPGNR